MALYPYLQFLEIIDNITNENFYCKNDNNIFWDDYHNIGFTYGLGREAIDIKT